MALLRVIISSSMLAAVIACVDCQDDEKEFKLKFFHFKINQKMRDNKFIIINGIGPTGKTEELKMVGMDYLFQSASVGDSLFKNSGYNSITLIRGNLRIDFPTECGDKFKYADKPVWYVNIK